MNNTYRINTDNTPAFMIDTEKQLPVLKPTVGTWYTAYDWDVTSENWKAGQAGQYTSNGSWIDSTGTDVSTEMIWCDFLEEHK